MKIVQNCIESLKESHGKKVFGRKKPGNKSFGSLKIHGSYAWFFLFLWGLQPIKSQEIRSQDLKNLKF